MTHPTTAANVPPWGSIAAALLVGSALGAIATYAVLTRRLLPSLSLPKWLARSEWDSSLVISESVEGEGEVALQSRSAPHDSRISCAKTAPSQPSISGNEALNAPPSTRPPPPPPPQVQRHGGGRSRRRSSLQLLLKSYMSATEAESLYSDLLNDDFLRVSGGDSVRMNVDSDHADVQDGSVSLRGNSVCSSFLRMTDTDATESGTVRDLFSREVSPASSGVGENDMRSDNGVAREVDRSMYELSNTDGVATDGERKDSDSLNNRHRSSSEFCKRNQSCSASSHPVDVLTCMRLSSERNSVFSNRQFYHTTSGAIISRLPSEPSIRRMSLRNLLHSSPLLRSFIDEMNVEEGSATSHHDYSIPPQPPSPSSQELNQLPSQSIRSVPDEPIYRVVITGGPCSGKTSCLSYLREVFVNIGFNVFCVPEVATLLHTGGVNLVLSSAEERITQQRVILQMMMMLEDAFYELASLRGRPSLILYDRGTMDGSAYCSDAEWQAILSVTGYSNEELCDVRYDAVVHLVTAAVGAEAAYTLANNAARSEGLEEARRVDAATRNAWRGHFLVGVVDNEEGGFERKLQRTAEFIAGVIGIALPTDKLYAENSTGAEHTELMRGSTTQENETQRKGDTMEGSNAGIHPVPLEAESLIPAIHPQPPHATLNVFGVSDHLQCHFFVNRVNISRIPADAVVTTVVVVPLSPLHPDYRSESIIRISSAYDSHPVYFRHVEFHGAVDLPLSPAAAVAPAAEATLPAGENQPDNRQAVATTGLPHKKARVQITKAAFQQLASRRDAAQPVICKTMTRFFYNMRHLTLVTFSHPRELRGFHRLVAPAGTTEEDLGDLVEVEPFVLLRADEATDEKSMDMRDGK